jgi:hypothetical protein
MAFPWTPEPETFITDFMNSCLPRPTLVNKPLKICAWRLESPPRACLYSGSAQINPRTFTAPHLLTKTLLEDRSKRPTPSAIHITTTQDESALRESLLHYAQTALLPHREQLPASKKIQPPLDTTLEEAITCLISPPLPENHTLTTINRSSPWQRDHIDHR